MSLIQIEKNFFELVPDMISMIKKNYEDKINRQSNLFDINENENHYSFLNKNSNEWSRKEYLLEEFKSLGFYISDHPLNDYSSIFSKLKIIPYSTFSKNDSKEGLVAGTIMSIQEKSAKGTPFAIAKFSDNIGEFELFIFSENLIKNRDKLKESESFILTLQKDIIKGDTNQNRINVKKILSLNEMVNKTYDNVSIELNKDFDILELKESLKLGGKTKFV